MGSSEFEPAGPLFHLLGDRRLVYALMADLSKDEAVLNLLLYREIAVEE
jgi:hypothetical protein